jgi:hypothetical protein
MELDICELDNINMDTNTDNFDDNFTFDNNFNTTYEEMPENIFPTKVINKVINKVIKNVHFDENNLYSQKPTHQSIPKLNAKMVRPKMPTQTPKISYEDILSKMGMFVSNGKLHLLDKNTLTPEKQKELLDSQKKIQPQQTHYQQQTQYQPTTNDIPNQNNSYIYNKLFKDKFQQPENTVRRPRTLQEYKRMLIEDHLKRERIRQIKSTKLIMPTSNINISEGYYPGGLQNKLFNLSKR